MSFGFARKFISRLESFFPIDPCILFLVSLSLSGVALRLSGMLASVFAATSNLGSRSLHLSLIVYPEL